MNHSSKFRLLNETWTGLLIGYLLGLSFLLIFKTILATQAFALSETTSASCQLLFLGMALLLGVLITKKFSKNFFADNPSKTVNTKEIILDISALSDERIIDLCATHLLDSRLVCPRFLFRTITQQKDFSEKAKKAFETFAKLELLSHLNIRFEEKDFPEMKEISDKILKLAKLLDAFILTSEMSRIQISSLEEVKVINLNSLAQALKPLMPRGEYIEIQIQRYGKEEKQGVGYLEDGTMVVINGGADFLGETITAQVVSIKHTTAGRMIFCNAPQEHML